MEKKVMVRYRGIWAHYEISTQTIGICEARLVKYDGKDHEAPPPQILMLKSFRHWIGSSDESALIEELGQSIETNSRNRDSSLSPESS